LDETCLTESETKARPIPGVNTSGGGKEEEEEEEKGRLEASGKTNYIFRRN